MLKFLALLIVAVVAVRALNFSDMDRNPEYNSRQKRDDEKQEFTDIKKLLGCCNDISYDAVYFKKMNEIKKDCVFKWAANTTALEHFDPFDTEKMIKVKDLIICAGHCFGLAVNEIDENGKLNPESIKKRYVDHLVGSVSWKKTVYEEYIDSCLTEVEGKPKNNDHKCNSATMEFHRCVWNKFVLGCPADMRVDSPKCNTMRERIAKGSVSYFHSKVLEDLLYDTY